MHPVFAVRLSVLRSCVLTTLCPRVHLLGEREERGEIGDGRGREREWGELEREGYGDARNGNARKNSPKTQQIWHLRTLLGLVGYCPCHTF